MQRTQISYPHFLGSWFKLALATSVAVIITSCSSSGGGDSNSGTTLPTEGTGPIAGTWDYCNSGLKLTLAFTDSRWIDSKTLHTTVDCSGATDPEDPFTNFIFEGTYELIGTTTSESGLEVQQINLVSDTFDGNSVVASAIVTKFNIVYTGMAGQLIFGKAGFSAEDRPTALDFDAPFIRR